MTTNPLEKYFRVPKIYIALPSRGQFYAPDDLDMPPNGEIPIFPMSAKDEMYARTPDALFSGAAITQIIESCAPNIKNPWNLPICDLNALLAAIRLASYGPEMEIGTVCPSCSSPDTINVDLQTVLGSMQAADYSKPLEIGDLSFSFKPLTYTMLNDINRSNFFDQRTLNAISGDDYSMTDEERAQQLGNAYRKISDLTMMSIAHTIASIKAPDAIVTDFDLILEFLMNYPKPQYVAIRDYGIEIRKKSDLKPLDVICPHCEHEYTQEFTLDISNFFGDAS
jgi:hypothetical protein